MVMDGFSGGAAPLISRVFAFGSDLPDLAVGSSSFPFITSLRPGPF
jgi:hypothetical protein